MGKISLFLGTKFTPNPHFPEVKRWLIFHLITFFQYDILSALGWQISFFFFFFLNPFFREGLKKRNFSHLWWWDPPSRWKWIYFFYPSSARFARKFFMKHFFTIKCHLKNVVQSFTHKSLILGFEQHITRSTGLYISTYIFSLSPTI